MPKTKAQHDKSLIECATCELLPVRDFLDNIMVRTDGCLVAGYSLSGISSYFADDDNLNEQKFLLESMIRSLPEESMRLQFRYEVRETSDGVIDLYSQYRRSDDASVVDMDLERERIYRNNEESNRYLTRSLYAYVIWSPETHIAMSLKNGGGDVPEEVKEVLKTSSLDQFRNAYSLFSQRKQVERGLRIHRAQADYFNTLLTGVESGLRSARLEPVRLTHNELFLVMEHSINPLDAVAHPVPPGTRKDADLEYISPRSRLASSTVKIHDNMIDIDGVLWSVITLKDPPDYTRPTMLREFLSLGVPMALSINLIVPDHQKALADFKSANKWIDRYSGGVQKSSPEADSAERELLTIRDNLASSSQKTVRFSMTVAVRTSFIANKDDDESYRIAKDQLARRRQQVLQVFVRMDGASAYAENLALKRLWINQIGGCADKDNREKTGLSTNAADLLPIEMPWTGTPRNPELLFDTPYNQALPYSPFDPVFDNANALVAAGPGTGKSMLVGKMLLTSARRNCKGSILEYGNSYQHVVEYLGGQMIEISLEAQHVINPFDLDVGETVPSNTHLAFLRELTRLMLNEDEKSKTDQGLLNAVLDEAIKETYKRLSGRTDPIPIYSDLAQELETYNDPRNKSLVDISRNCATKLKQWIDKGTYANLFDRKTTVRMDARWLYFNIQKLKSSPLLNKAMSFVIAYSTAKRSDGRDDVRCYNVWDEAWAMFKSDSGLISVGEDILRTARKRGSSIWFIVQNVSDALGTVADPSGISGAIKSSTGFALIGRNGGSPAELKHYLKMSNVAVDYYASLGSTEKGVRSQFLLQIGDLTQPIFVVPTPLEYWLLTTYKPEITYRQYWLNKHVRLPLQQRYRMLAERFPKGISSLGELPEVASGEVARGATEEATIIAREQSRQLQNLEEITNVS